MSNIIEINDFFASELDIYARLNENQLVHYFEPELGLFIAESPNVIERAINAGYEPVSFLMEPKHIDKEMNVVEIVRSIFPAKTKDFVTAVDEHSVILVKELREKETAEEIDRIAKTIEETLNAETNSHVYISSGTIVSDLKDVSIPHRIEYNLRISSGG
mgnify:CR=1 FL=1